MSKSFEEAAAEARRRRETLLKTLEEVRERATPARLADDALTLLDPKLTFLAQVKRRVARNKLLSLAVLAGAAWLAGMPRHLDGKPPAARKPPRAKPKEKNNDSGQHQRNQRPEPGTGQRGKVARTKERVAQAQRLDPERSLETRTDGGIAPLDGEPERFAVGAVGVGPLAVEPV